MRYLTADYIFPVSSPPLKNGVVMVNEDGSIAGIRDHTSGISATELETYRGVICPGFINAHCHLELSHLKGKLTPGKGLPHFIREISKSRTCPEAEIKQAIIQAEDEMISGGIVAAGDICNFNHTFEQKKKGRLRYHTFIEIFDLSPTKAEEAFENGLALLKEARSQDPGLRVSVTPHAPYTVSSKLFNLIHDYAYANNSLLSIHNQETGSENELFLRGKGELFEALSSFGDHYKGWQPTGLNSLASALSHLPKRNKIQLVHNTFTTAADITLVHLYSMFTWWCTCPNANLFIENRLPDYRLFADAACRMTIGTDSYASNRTLSILDELKTISNHASYISLEKLIRWATLNGAEFLGFDKELGSLEEGKKPGINVISNLDLENLKLTRDSDVKRIV